MGWHLQCSSVFRKTSVLKVATVAASEVGSTNLGGWRRLWETGTVTPISHVHMSVGIKTSIDVTEVLDLGAWALAATSSAGMVMSRLHLDSSGQTGARPASADLSSPRISVTHCDCPCDHQSTVMYRLTVTMVQHC